MDEPFLEQTRRHQQKSLLDTLTACLPCFPKGRKAGEPASSANTDVDDVPSGDDARLRQSLRSSELQLQQAEQRFAAANIAREKVQKELERERSLRTQAEDALAICRRSSSDSKPPAQSSNNSAALVEKDKEITSLKQQVDRYSKKLATLEKYKDSLEAQIQQATSNSSAGKDQEQALRKQLSEKTEEVSRLTATINQLQAELKKEKEQLSGDSEEKRKSDSIRVELEAKVKELEAEIAFRDSIEKQIGDPAPATSAPPARASRGRAIRGRSIRPVGSTSTPAAEDNAKTEPSADSTAAPDSPGGDPPPVPQRGSIHDRMKAFQ